MNYGKWAFGLAVVAVLIATAGLLLIYTRFDPVQTQDSDHASQDSTTLTSESMPPTAGIVIQSPIGGTTARDAYAATAEANRQIIHDATFAVGEFLRTTDPFMTPEQRADILADATKVKTVYQQTTLMSPPSEMQAFHTKWITALLNYSEAADEWIKYGNNDRADLAAMMVKLDAAWTTEQEAWQLLPEGKSRSRGTAVITDRLVITEDLLAAYNSDPADAGTKVLEFAGIDPNSSLGREYLDNVSRNAATWYQTLEREIGRVPRALDFYQRLRTNLLRMMFLGS